jgi:beta-lactamase regulating signal transducer with metallopeptidase domain
MFLGIYDFFLSKETFFTKNRWYLLSTPILSFLIPLIKIPSFQKAVSQEYIVYLPEIFLSPEKAIQQVIEEATFYQSINYITILFWIGAGLFLMLFLMKLGKIINLIRKYKTEQESDFTLIFIPNQTKAFSFFNYIFVGNEIPFSQQEKIIQHELVHSKQKHSLDLLLFELLKIIMWFKPMIYLYQKRITLVHEYIADAVATKASPKENYINQLLSNFFQVENIAFVNQFYKQSLIKKRIIMMKKKQSKKTNQLKYLILIPMLASMLFYISCSEDSSEETFAKKQVQTRYSNKDGALKAEKGKKETYLDSFFGFQKPIKGEEIYLKDLSVQEREEYDSLISKFKEKSKAFSKTVEGISFYLYKMSNGRNMYAMIIDVKELSKRTEKENKISGDVSFMTIETAPTFPGCDSGDKDCFSRMVQKHFARNFDADLTNSLGLSAGKKRVFIGFKVDVNGDIVDIKARAPHVKIKEEVIRVMSSLPNMIAGENKGEKVVVSYNIPFSLNVGGVDTE